MHYIGGVFDDCVVEIDGNYYEDVSFNRCKIKFKASKKIGSDKIGFVNCRFFDCVWIFDGAAGDTILFLKKIIPHLDERMRKQMLNELFGL